MNTQNLALALLTVFASMSIPSFYRADAAEPNAGPSGPGPGRIGRFGSAPIDLPFLNRFSPRRAEEAKREEARKAQAGLAKDTNTNIPTPNTPNTKAAERKAAQIARSSKQPPNAKPTATLPAPVNGFQKLPVPVAAPSAAIIPALPESEKSPSPAPTTTPAPVAPRDPEIFSVLVSEKNPATSEWKPLFNGKDLTSWQSSKFGGDGEITVADAAIVLGVGGDMTGITYTGEVPKMNYALEVEAQRREGSDFFAGITFPVAESHVTLVPGGWGGGVFGISCINLNDASENETTKPMTFEDKKWYVFRIQVTEGRIQVWIDGKQEIDLNTTDKKLSTRGEVESSKPLGISTWRTAGAIRAIKLRSLTPQEILAAAKK